MVYTVHDSAVIDQGATIGENTNIWHFSHVCSGAKIGNECSLGQNVFIGNQTVIGNNVKIQNNVSVYDGVTLEDYVFCGPSMVFTNVYNPRSHIIRKNEYQPTLVKKGATIGANATIICGVTIGEYAFIGAGSVVKSDVKPYAIMLGIPAKLSGFMCQCGLRLDIDILEQAEIELLKQEKQVQCTCGLSYSIVGQQCRLITK